MAEKETKNNPKDIIEALPEELSKLDLEKELSKSLEEKVPEKETEKKDRERNREEQDRERILDSWIPKTILGKKVKSGEFKDFDALLDSGKKIIEPEVADKLLNLKSDLLLIGQAKGKFGGGKRRAWRQTQKKTMEGNVVTFSCMAVVGDKKGHVGIGLGKAKETLPSREKALREAKLNIIKIKLGFEDPTENKHKNLPHTIPHVVEGKCGSVRVKLLPAPRGTGLAIGDEGKKILSLAGIEDIYSVSSGQTRTTFNFAKAIIDALIKTGKLKA